MTLIPLLLAAVLASSSAPLVRAQQGTMVRVPSGSALAYFPFSTSGCYPSGSAMGTKGETVTVTRSTTATYQDASGVIATCAAGQARVGCDGGNPAKCGLLVEPARTNLALQSAGFDATPWGTIASGTATIVTADQGVAPDGTTTADLMNIQTLVNGEGTFAAVRQSAGVLTNGSVYTFSFYAKAGTLAGALPFSISTAGPNNYFATGSCSLSASTWTRCSVTGTVPSVATGSFISIGPVYVAAQGATQTAGTGTVYLWGAQIEAGPYATAYIPTAGTAVTRNADAITITNPLAATNPLIWCVDGTYTPESGRAWAQAALPAAFSGGTDAGANSTRLYADGSGALVFDVYDSAGAQKRGSYTHGFAAGSTHRLAAGSVSGALSLAVDSATATLTGSGAGTGILGTPPATLRLGAASTGATEGGGFIRSFKVSRGVCR